MKPRSVIFLGTAALCLLIALSTGAQIYLLFFLVLAFMLLLALISSLLGFFTLKISSIIPKQRLTRGGTVTLTMQLSHRCFLPLAPIHIFVESPDCMPPYELRADSPPFKTSVYKQTLPCPHVGSYTAGVTGYQVADAFGLFIFRRNVPRIENNIFVRPKLHSVQPLPFSTSDTGFESGVRSLQDNTEPADVRSYVQGDELKHVHWKLTMRKREIMVRQFEAPIKPDTLILMDCHPYAPFDENTPDLRDAMCEIAYAISEAQVRAGYPVRMPLHSAIPNEVALERADNAEAAAEALSKLTFDGKNDFESVLRLETRRLQRTGGLVVITAKLTPSICQTIIQMRTMGPRVRVYLVAPRTNDALLSMIWRLENAMVECFITAPSDALDGRIPS